MKFNTLLLHIVAVCTCLCHAFRPGPEPAIGIDLTDLENQQAIMTQSQEQLANRFIQSLVKIDAVKAKASADEARLRIKLSRAIEKITQVSERVDNMSTEVKAMVTTKTDEDNSENNEITTRGVCDSSKGYFNLTSTMCIRFSNDSQTWTESRKLCQQDGADLVTFRSREEQDKLVKYLDGIWEKTWDKNLPFVRVWIGMHVVNGNFTWVTDSPFEGYFWSRKTPKHTNCTTLLKYGLRNIRCKHNCRYVCRVQV